MIIDTSALIAILLGEPEAELFAHAIADAPQKLVSTFTALETGIVIEAKKGDLGGRELDILIHKAKIEIVPLTTEQLEIARSAWRKYGKGRHPAGLNIGDCCSYALAKSAGEPLLFKGSDFLRQTLKQFIGGPDRSRRSPTEWTSTEYASLSNATYRIPRSGFPRLTPPRWFQSSQRFHGVLSGKNSCNNGWL